MLMDRLFHLFNHQTLLAISLGVALLFNGCRSRHANHEKESLVSEKESTYPLIIIDAGHGGKDTGAVSPSSKVIEKDLTLKTAKLVQKYLKEMGYSTYMMRTRDEFIDLDKRVAIASGKPQSVLVSLHFNSAKNRYAEGIEIFYSDDPEDGSRHLKSLKLAEFILKESTQMTKAVSRGCKPAAFRVIKNTNMPACLVEGGFVTNFREAKRLTSTRYLEKLAHGIASGINLYCRSRPIRTSPAAKPVIKPQVKVDVNSLKKECTPSNQPLKPALERICPT